jgi:hypothetical protein
LSTAAGSVVVVVVVLVVVLVAVVVVVLVVVLVAVVVVVGVRGAGVQAATNATKPMHNTTNTDLCFPTMTSLPE